MKAVNILQMHLPVVSGNVRADGGLAVAKPFIYGTAFPFASPGVFATAGHVLESALADGEPCLTLYAPDDGGQLPTHRLTRHELFKGIDFALLECPSLAALPPIPVSFEPLEYWDAAMTLGYPFAVDAEYVNVVPRAFRGYVITRRELLHVQPAQPTGYELSFPTPKGTSGAPLLGGSPNALTCRGYIIQQTTLGGSDEGMIAGLAVASMAWLSLQSEMLGKPVAEAFGRSLVVPPPRSAPRRPGGIDLPSDLADGWPDDTQDPADPEAV